MNNLKHSNHLTLVQYTEYHTQDSDTQPTILSEEKENKSHVFFNERYLPRNMQLAW